MNRFAIDEDAKNEILKIYQLEKDFNDLYEGRLALEEGLDLINHRIAYDSQGWNNFARSVQETQFFDIIDSGVATMVDFGKNDMMPHFIYCNEDMLNYYRIDKNLKKLILTKMRKYGLPSSIFTTLRMTRVNLMTKEKSKHWTFILLG